MKRFMSPPHSQKTSAFSLIELLVSMGILSVLMLLLTQMLEQVQKSWTYSESRISQFREARVAFDLVTKNLGQANLNTYYDLKDSNKDGLVDGYYRTSELHFLTLEASKDLPASATQEPVGQAIFFQAPLGFSSEYRNLNGIFNGRGYFVAYGSDRRFKPSFVKSEDRMRFRLMEFRPPAESNQVFADGQEEREAGEPEVFTAWYRQSMSGVGEGNFEDHLNPLAENIIMLIVSPRDSLEPGGRSRKQTFSEIAPRYTYDSAAEDFDFSQQVPPLVRVTMVAIDETSALRVEKDGKRPDLLEAAWFKDTDKYADDIVKLTDSLNEKKVIHKIFSSMVMLRSAKWSVEKQAGDLP